MLPAPVFTTDLGTLYEGDCLKILPEIPAESVDLAFADPPFNLGKKYASRMNDSIKDHDYVDWCRTWVQELIRVLAPGGSLFLYNLPKWNLALSSMLLDQLTFRHWITVDMKYSLPIAGRLYPANYSLLYFVNGKRPKAFHPDRVPLRTCRHCGGELQDYGGYKNKMNPRGVNLSDVWSDIPPVRHQKYKDRESNQLSLKLMDRVISMASDEGSVVLDPFGGSGTTFVAAELLHRKWIGTEIHCAEIIRRFEDLSSEEAHLMKIQQSKNILFTGDSLKKRAKNGYLNDKYNAGHSLERARMPIQSEVALPLFS